MPDPSRDGETQPHRGRCKHFLLASFVDSVRAAGAAPQAQAFASCVVPSHLASNVNPMLNSAMEGKGYRLSLTYHMQPMPPEFATGQPAALRFHRGDCMPRTAGPFPPCRSGLVFSLAVLPCLVRVGGAACGG